jgi:hypothetical protein
MTGVRSPVRMKANEACGWYELVSFSCALTTQAEASTAIASLCIVVWVLREAQHQMQAGYVKLPAKENQQQG